MQQTLLSPLSRELLAEAPQTAPFADIDRARLIEYFGTVNYATNERVLSEISELMTRASSPITMMVTSSGGPTGTAMSFYDTVRSVLAPTLTTIGAGDVDSSGILVFLTGERRYVTRHTTLLLHPAGRVFESGTRFTASELAAMVREDRLKDAQYASIVAERSRGVLTARKVRALMERHTVLTAEELVAYGLADGIIG